MAARVEIMDEKPLVTRILPDVFEPIYMDKPAAQRATIAGKQVWVCQIHRQDGIVFLDIRAEKEERRAVESEFELRQKAGVAQIETVRAARASRDVTARIE